MKRRLSVFSARAYASARCIPPFSIAGRTRSIASSVMSRAIFFQSSVPKAVRAHTPGRQGVAPLIATGRPFAHQIDHVALPAASKTSSIRLSASSFQRSANISRRSRSRRRLTM